MPSEASDIFNAKSQALRHFLQSNGLGLYIPAYQRHYSWSKDQVRKLFIDALDGLHELLSDEDSFTFIGSVITVHDTSHTTIQPAIRNETPSKVLIVIDGQQRLTSFILICMCLHNEMNLRLKKFLAAAGDNANDQNTAEGWLHGHVKRLLEELAGTFYERQHTGDSPLYPRMIRAFKDQWSSNSRTRMYESPIAYIVFKYLEEWETGRRYNPTFMPGWSESEKDIIKRLRELRGMITLFIENKEIEDAVGPASMKEISNSLNLQKALFIYEFPEYVQQQLLSAERSEHFDNLFRCAVLSSFMTNRIAATIIKGINENYAFSIFESLNTTGEPLTAFETFKPRVVAAETLGAYERSDSKTCVDEIEGYLNTYEAGKPRSDATRDFLISFAMAENGKKLTKRLADQRKYLKDCYDIVENESKERGDFVRHLAYTSNFLGSAWKDPFNIPKLGNDATTGTVRLCLSFLQSMKHSITIPVIVRFLSVAIDTNEESKIEELRQAIKAITAFSALRRAGTGATEGIDNEYRELMLQGDESTEFEPLARSLSTQPDVKALKRELKRRLTAKGLGNKEEWTRKASQVPIYVRNNHVTRFILLAAHNDTAVDPNEPGLVITGRANTLNCFDYEYWKDDSYLTVEHVAPQRPMAEGWDSNIYDDDSVVHTIGNLILAPNVENNVISNRSWKTKRVIYQALGARTPEQSRSYLAAISDELSGETIDQLVDQSRYLPLLESIGQKTSGDWDVPFIRKRSKRILELAWDKLFAWLN